MSDSQKEKNARLKEIRLTLGITQSEMAKLLGVSRPNLSKIENGEENRNVPKDAFWRLREKIGNLRKEWWENGQGAMLDDTAAPDLDMEYSVVKRRISEFAKLSGIGKADIYRDTGMSNGTLSQPNGISEENLLRFLNSYKEVSAEWLLRGTGNMMKNSEAVSANSDEIEKLKAEKDYFFNRTLELERELKSIKSKRAAG